MALLFCPWVQKGADSQSPEAAVAVLVSGVLSEGILFTACRFSSGTQWQ